MPDPELRHIEQQLAGCLIRDRNRLRRELQRARFLGGKGRSERLAQIAKKAAEAAQRRAQREALFPKVQIEPRLPIAASRDELARTISGNPVTVVSGETGSGKSTQLPKICLQLGLGLDGLIGHTQPRRIAARSIAARIASELGSEVGALVGFQVRHEDQTGPDTLIKVMTDGILLAELEYDRLLERYQVIIIDEAHERSLNIDFLLGYLKRILPQRPDLKLIISSATIDVQHFSRHFGGAPIVEVTGRMYPVEIRYRPPPGADDEGDARLAAFDAILDELDREASGDVLVFLEGEREIAEAAEHLHKRRLPNTAVFPLYARLSADRQSRVFQPHRNRHIVLATNVAETSLTIPGIRYVVDFGRARISRYSHRSKVQRLPVEPVSRASADQRAGRCGRIANGICFRVYEEQDFLARPPYTEPEIQRTNLAAVILQMKALRLGRIEHFPLLEPPEPRFINDGLKLLQELQAITRDGHLTETGRRLSRLPLDPRLGRMLLAAAQHDCVADVLVIVSALAVPDVRERNFDQPQRAQEAHARFNDAQSDFLWFLNLWRALHGAAGRVSARELRSFCDTHLLSFPRLRDWIETHRQLRLEARGLGLELNTRESTYEAIQRALIPGLLGHVAVREEHGDYTGARNTRLRPWPLSSVIACKAKWIVAAELVETTRLYARTAARIEPEWLLDAATHLVQRDYTDAFWEQRSGKARALERDTLYGLVLGERRLVDYGEIAPEAARGIFIQALADGRFLSRDEFYRHNQKLIGEIRYLEAKVRRPDILNEKAVAGFYAGRVPAGIHSTALFESWWKARERREPRWLFLERDAVMNYGTDERFARDYPDRLESGKLHLPLGYKHDPSQEDDGITVTIPLSALNQVRESDLDRLVPGLLPEKVDTMLRSLPKPLRKSLAPIAGSVKECLPLLANRDAELPWALAAVLKELRNVDVAPAMFAGMELPHYLRLWVRVSDASGKALAGGRDLREIQNKLKANLAAQVGAAHGAELQRQGIQRWDFDDLPATVVSRVGKLDVHGYPALVDDRDTVSIRVFADEPEARTHLRQGLLRLFMLELAREVDYLKRHVVGIEDLLRVCKATGFRGDVSVQIATRAVARACLDAPDLIRTRSAFEAAKTAGAPRLVELANEIGAAALGLLQLRQELQAELHRKPALPQATTLDLGRQLERLLHAQFIADTPDPWLGRLPKYLHGMKIRMQRARGNPAGDAAKMSQLAPHEAALDALAGAGVDGTELEEFKWLLEEFRISIYAQELRTVVQVSAKRLREKQEALQRRAQGGAPRLQTGARQPGRPA